MPDYSHATPAEIKARLDAGETLRIWDVREPMEWEICRIEGAELKPLSQFAQWSAELEGNTDPVVLHCHHGMRSQQACEYLAAQGIAGLINMLGGINAWADTVDPSLQRY